MNVFMRQSLCVALPGLQHHVQTKFVVLTTNLRYPPTSASAGVKACATTSHLYLMQMLVLCLIKRDAASWLNAASSLWRDEV